MSRRKVQEISPISATASSRQVEINQTNSILSDPDGRWVAKRQAAINQSFEKRQGLESSKGGASKIASHKAQQVGAVPDGASAKFSGESDRIGRLDWDENTPPGKHVGFF